MYPTLLSEHNRDHLCYQFKNSTNMEYLVIITKKGKLRFSIRFLSMLHLEFVNATKDFHCVNLTGWRSTLRSLVNGIGGAHVLQLSTRSTRVAICCRHHLETLCQKTKVSAYGNPNLWCNVSLINLCAYHLNGSIIHGSSWEAVFCGLHGF